MADMNLNNLIAGKLQRPVRMSLYGVDGIGKSTFAANAPSPIFIGAEDGTAHLDVTRFQRPETWEDIMAAIGVLYEQEHDFKTLVLDTADWAEDFARQSVCQEHQVTGIESLGYGKGFTYTAEKFITLLRGFDALYQARSMNIIVISHCQVATFNDPENEPYDRYQMKLDKRIEPKIREWCDVNAFANYDTSVAKTGEGPQNKKTGDFLKKQKNLAVSYGKRLLFTERRAAFDAKNRYSLPDRLPLDWPAFASAMEQATNPEPAQAA